jgi:solute carrier family 25 S-adenosylmethionine transporter 26
MLHSAGRIAFPASATSQVAVAVLAGSVASATVDTVIYPLDTLKTRMQAPAGFRRSGGFVNLFAGVVPTALSAIPGGAVFFGVYEPAKQLIGGDGEPSAAWSRDATAAGLAAAASCGIRAPAAVVTQRMQVGQYHSIVEAMRGIASSGGLGAFFAGLGISAARELPFACVNSLSPISVCLTDKVTLTSPLPHATQLCAVPVVRAAQAAL